MIVVTGATGNIGRQVVSTLCSAGIPVRAVSRSEKRLAQLEAQGADIAVADVTDREALKRAFAQAQAIFTMIPPNFTAEDFRGYQNQVADNYAEAIATHQVHHVVNLSSIGAQLEQGAGPVNGLHDAELRLNRLRGTAVLHLRPAFFMENFFMGLELIREQGIYGSPLKPDLPVPMIATRDIAASAADFLSRRNFAGKTTRELLGPRELTMREATAALGQAIGRPDLPYVQFPYESAEQALVSQGVAQDLARQYIELYRSTNEGRFRPTEKRGSQNTTETTIEVFAREVFAPAFGRKR